MTEMSKEAISTSRALKLALGALKNGVDGQTSIEMDEAVTAMREALASEAKEQPAQQQEPVAVVSGYYGGQCVILPIDPARIFNSNTALYTSPPAQRKPLGLEQRMVIADKFGMSFNSTFTLIVQEIEAAHGIK